LPEKVRLALTVNGGAVVREVDESLSLLRFLREELGLVGAKNGCEKGHCGACTVIVDGQARRSCVLKASRCAGSRIETVEGLALPGGGLHPIQRAFVLEGAVQCGFCTPGMIMSTKALLDRSGDPSEAEIEEALRFNLCRCTGYAAIRRAVLRAARSLRPGGSPDDAGPASSGARVRAVGSPLPRKDAPLRARGEGLFAEDIADRRALVGSGGTLVAPGERILVGSMLFSAHAHARIRSIDVSRAASSEGVALVLTAGDVPGRNAFGLFVPQQPVIAGDEVMYLGDVVAVVVAETRELAEKARGLVEVDYEVLPAAVSAEANLESGAPLLHPDKGSNVVHETHVRKGDVAAAFASADLVIEHDYDTQSVEHAYLEPESCLALPDADGGVTVYTGNQGSTDYRDMIAASLALAEEKVRVVLVACGGGFGGKEEPTVQIQAALAAVRTGKPVRMTLSREESLRMSTKRHPMRIRMAHAAMRDGRIVGFRSRVVADAGAYVSQTAPVVFRSAVTATGPYEVGAVEADSYGVYTHRNPSGAFRGFGSTQAAFACEIQMDEIARELGMDPVELRRRSGFATGRRTGTGQLLGEGIGYLGTLEAAAAGLERMRAELGARELGPGRRMGFGIASSYKNVGIGTGLDDGAGAIVELLEEGRVSVRTGAADMGQGSDTVAAQIAADELGLPYELVDVLSCDTRSCPDGGMTTASRQTFVTGNAVKKAAGELRGRLAAYLPADAALDAAAVSAALREARGKALAAGLSVMVESRYRPPATKAHRTSARLEAGEDESELDIHYAYCFASAAVAVEVDLETGKTRVLKVCAAQDSGTAINPLSVRGQIEGSVAMGIGYALTEEFVSGEGGLVTKDLRALGLPRIADLPPIEAVIVETPQPGGPFGAKGMGEVGLNPLAPAISNAIFDAVGIRLRSLPMTPAKLLAAKGAQADLGRRP
jgi:CO/xanthine dehydrogenase Mo-binding subunit/aerobic-type carbon monoxide dehydrogenase small subunit (CoxS/CutS family)